MIATRSAPGYATQVDRAETAAVAKGTIANTGAASAVVKGKLYVGHTLRVGLNPGPRGARSNVPAGTTIKYRWFANKHRARRGADGPRLTLLSRYVGKRIKVRIAVRAPGYRTERITIRIPGRVAR